MFLNKDFSRIYLTIPALPQSGSHFPQLVLVTLSMVVVVAAAVIEECIFTASVSCDRLREEICLEQIEIFHAGADKGSSPHSHDHWHNLNKLYIHTISTEALEHTSQHSSLLLLLRANPEQCQTIHFGLCLSFSVLVFCLQNFSESAPEPTRRLNRPLPNYVELWFTQSVVGIRKWVAKYYTIINIIIKNPSLFVLPLFC